MELRGVGAAAIAGCGLYLLFGGHAVMTSTDHHMSQERAAMCLSGVAGNLPEKNALVCAGLFTNPGLVVRRLVGDEARMAGLPVTRHELRQIHHAVLVGAPDSMVSAASFDVWWRSLPVKDS